ncbi:acid phosphatase 1-like [Macadamia integrifolia]|uniref:acid phosphatase 1-like n=1 Tax=Macadamia integrifolia TaxID=60698 RepID=UPI001C4E67BB|nr:acid phosphatase 1-like [Macadamia integrifolia]
MECAGGRLFYLILLLLSILLSGVITSSVSGQSVLQILPGNRKIRGGDDGIWCESWRYTVETNDAGFWDTIPERCEGFVKDYMTGDRYLSDSEAVAEKALSFASTVKLAGDGKDAWVFDIDETLLSNLPYYALYGFGAQGFNESTFDEWVDLAEAPSLPASLKLYNSLKELGFTVFLLTGRSEYQRNATEKNMLYAGYSSWEKLFLRGPSDSGTPAIVYKPGKRMEIEAQGYRIHGSSGDQWSDLLGKAMAERCFKLPNPMYYIA